MLADVAAEREKASEAMDFEGAAALHKQWEKVKAAAGMADELVRPVAELRAVVLQESAPRADGEKLEEAAVFLLERGRIVGPERLSTLGVRAVREQTAVGSSLFAQPLMLAAVPLEQVTGNSEQKGKARFLRKSGRGRCCCGWRSGRMKLVRRRLRSGAIIFRCFGGGITGRRSSGWVRCFCRIRIVHGRCGVC